MNYHVKTVSEDGRNAIVVFHISIPIEQNSASIDLRTALSQSIDSSNFVSEVPWIAGAELTQIQNGELYEHVETVKFLAEDSDLQKQTKIDNRYTALITGAVAKARAVLKFWGKDRNIV